MQETTNERLRHELVAHWVSQNYPQHELTPVSSDASVRRYYRLSRDGQSLILMDAPPSKLDCRPFVQAARRFAGIGLHVPDVIQADLTNGLLVLSDLGNMCYLQAIGQDNADALYGDALQSLLKLQLQDSSNSGFPPYNRDLLQRELHLFDEWLLNKHLGVILDSSEIRNLETVYEELCASALRQPQVWVHRDYHSRNLMSCDAANPGILDFQDAIIGPVTYDLVSLLKDCYVDWPTERVESWALQHRRALHHRRPELAGADDKTWLRWFDLMGVQRHLKAAGIFARLNLRDHKSAYLADIPRTLAYVSAASKRYDELAPLTALLDRHLADIVEQHIPCG